MLYEGYLQRFLEWQHSANDLHFWFDRFLIKKLLHLVGSYLITGGHYQGSCRRRLGFTTWHRQCGW